MTLQQLKYIIGIVNSGSINEAAKRLFICQPSLSKAVRELENELNFRDLPPFFQGHFPVFGRDGIPFLRAPSCGTGGTSGTALPEYKTSQTPIFHLDCSASLFLAVNAFVNLIKKLNIQEYEWTLEKREPSRSLKMSINPGATWGILYLNDFNRAGYQQASQKERSLFPSPFPGRTARLCQFGTSPGAPQAGFTGRSGRLPLP